MLRMIDKEYIRKKHFLEGWSIHELSRQLKISRQTVLGGTVHFRSPFRAGSWNLSYLQ